MATVIDISDDDIQEIPSKSKKPKSFKCLNSDCRTVNDLVKATNNVRRFYSVLSYPKKTKVCAKCSAYAKLHEQAMIDSVRVGNFFKINHEGFVKHRSLVLMDSDSDLTDEECESEESEFEFDPAEFYCNQQSVSECGDMEIDEEYDQNDPQERIRELITNISEELGLKRQVDEGSNHIKKKLTAAETALTDLNDEYSTMGAQLDKIRFEFYSTFQQNIRWLPELEIGSPESVSNPDFTVIDETSYEEYYKSLPPLGQLDRQELSLNENVYCIKHSLLANWVDAKIVAIEEKEDHRTYRVSYLKKNAPDKLSSRFILGQHIAYFDPCNVRIPVGTRIIAKFKDECHPTVEDGFYFVGIVSEIPNATNKFRYLVFFDDGYAQYVRHADVRVVAECSSQPWEDVAPDSREFIKDYLRTYPERPMVRLQQRGHLITECDGEWIKAKVLEVDGSLVKMYFPPDRNRIGKTEWIYRGSTRLSPLFNKKIDLQSKSDQKNKIIRRRTMPINKSGPFVEYVNFGQEQERPYIKTEPSPESTQSGSIEVVPTEKRAVARKSTSGRPGTPPQEVQEQIYQEARGVVRKRHIPSDLPSFTPHQCGPECDPNKELTESNVPTLLRPILRGWRRQISKEKKKSLSKNVTSYIAPCGRRLRNIEEAFRFLRLTKSDLEIDFFSFEYAVDTTIEWEPSRKHVYVQDMSDGVEQMAISCVNSLDKTQPLPLIYCNVRQPTKDVNLNLDPSFLVCCSCTDDCQDKSRCECWQMTMDAYKNVYKTERMDIGYKYRRLPDQVASGIYECNSRCSCKMTCLNRVVQHPLKQKLQLFKTARRGWGVRTLHDLPQGTFVAVYVGKVLNEALANQEGKMTTGGDDYYAELDFIEIVESMKEDYESDVEEDPEFEDEQNDLEAIQISGVKSDCLPEPGTDNLQKDDSDFAASSVYAVDRQPPGQREKSARIQARSKRTSSLNSSENESGNSSPRESEDNRETPEDDDIQQRKRQTFEPVSELRPPVTHKTARELYGNEEAVYIMDAKISGNIGRYFNHSCQPNIFVQNVFVDTHDMRFPWVAFFTSTRIRGGTELTWDYNYEIGSVPGKIKYCYCMSRKCRGRLL